MLVSFVTPTYNDDPEHLRQCVESVRAQTHASVEHVIVDDGSTDRRASEWAEGQGVRAICQENAGPGAARNAGAESAAGDVLVFLDADDYVSPTLAAEAVEILGDAGVTIAFPLMREFGARSNVDARSADRGLVEFFSCSGVPIGSACRRADFDAAGGFDASIRGGYEDQEFWLRLMLTRPGVARRMPTAALHYRVRDGSRSSLVGTPEGTALTRRRAIANAAARGQTEALAMGLWDAVDREVEKRRAVTTDRLYLRPHAARLRQMGAGIRRYLSTQSEASSATWGG